MIVIIVLGKNDMDDEAEDYKINSPIELYDLIRKESIENLLLGNGFVLSHFAFE